MSQTDPLAFETVTEGPRSTIDRREVTDLGAEPNASITWGKPQVWPALPTHEYIIIDAVGDFLDPDVESVDDGSEDPEQLPVVELTEVSRTTTTTRIENPSDPLQYVDVEDATSITFRSGSGQTYILNFAERI